MQGQPQTAWIFAAIMVAFPLIFIAIWSGVCGLMTLVSGWRAMAERYPCPEGLEGRELDAGHTLRVGVARYRGVISLEAAPQGLIVRVMKLFPFHAPLLLPWGGLRLVVEEGVFSSAGRMEVEGGATFHLNREAFASIEQAARARG